MNDDAAPITVVTRDLVARVEQAILAERRAFALGSPGERPDGAVLEIGSGAAIFTGRGLFSNRVFGVGLDGSLAEGDLDRFEAFYRRRGVPTEVEVVTLVDRSFLQQLAHRGYHLLRFHNIYAMVMPRAAPLDREVEVLAVAPDSVEEWSQTLIDVFAPSDPAQAHAVAQWNRGLLDTEGIHPFIGRLDGSTVGSASVYLSGGCAVLGGAATLPAWRRRGIQTALIAARLDLARRAGCDLAVVTADPGSISGRNAERAGFTLVCTHAVLTHTN